jgi:DNA repair protein RadD
MATKKGRKAIFFADRRKLVDQAAAELERHGIQTGIIMAGRKMNRDAPVQVASIQTLSIRAVNSDRLNLPEADLLFIDEAHKALGEQYLTVIREQYPNAFVIGMTATPARSDGRGLGELFEDLVTGPTVQELTDQGHLVRMRYYAPTTPDLDYLDSIVDKRKNDYNEARLGEYMEGNKILIGDIVEHYSRLAYGMQAVVFASSVKHSIFIAEAFNAKGIPAEHIDGTTEQTTRDAIYARVRNGQTYVLTNCNVLIEGWDEPRISACILARPTKSITAYLQMAGRVLRPYPGKEEAILIDHSGIVHELGFVTDTRPWSLDPEETINERAERKKQEEKEKTEQAKIVCEQCHIVYAGQLECPVCGWTPPKRGKMVETLKLDLQEIKRVQEAEYRQSFYSRALGLQYADRLQKGWADEAYRMKFKEAPPESKQILPPDDEIRRWKKYMLIRASKSRFRRR